MLHAVTARSRAAGVPEEGPELAHWDMLAEITREAEKNQGQSLALELKGITIRCILLKGDPVQAILQTARGEKANLIMMPSHGFAFNQFLLGSVTAKVLYGTECPVWTSAHMDEPEPPSKDLSPLYGSVDTGDTIGHEVRPQPAQQFAIRSVLCAVDLSPRSSEALSWAAQIAAEFGARLTLAHVTASVEIWGPGGDYANPRWKQELVDDAAQRLAQLQTDTSTKAEVFIGSGDVPKVLSQAAKQTMADLLVVECYPYGGNLRIHGYAIICAVPIPVLSV